MANNKTFKGRISNKHDTSTNWLTASNNGFIPLDGEIIIYDDLNRIKIGDGSTKVNDLPFLNYSEEEIQALINGSLSELTFGAPDEIAGYSHPYVEAIVQNNGIISPVHKDLFETLGPLVLKIDTLLTEGYLNIIESSEDLSGFQSAILYGDLASGNKDIFITEETGTENFLFRLSTIMDDGNNTPVLIFKSKKYRRKFICRILFRCRSRRVRNNI